MSGLSRNRILVSCLGLYAAAQLLFLINIQFPKTPNFDEFHYVPSAKQFLAMTENQNWEHPPLGKQLMAIGIGIFGDRPIGWRFMSTVFGALTLVGMYLWGLAVFKRERDAWFVAILTLFNQLLYVQARIGMLDTFMMAFLSFAFAGFSAAWTTKMDPRRQYRYLLFSGAMFGLATATKWAAVVPWVGCLMLYGLLRLFQYWTVEFRHAHDDDWYSPKLWGALHWHHLAVALGVLPVALYLATFLPYLFIHRTPAYGFGDLIAMQWKMWDGQLRVVTEHPYNSKWPGWPFMLRPIWYAFDKETGENFVRGVLLLGNPLLMWGGLVALAACAWGWVVRRSRESFLILAFFAVLYFSWAAIPRKIAFYYYYYPAGMTLSLAITYAFQVLEESSWRKGIVAMRWAFIGATIGLFIYFFPILAALQIPSESFRKWMWLPTWI